MQQPLQPSKCESTPGNFAPRGAAMGYIQEMRERAYWAGTLEYHLRNSQLNISTADLNTLVDRTTLVINKQRNSLDLSGLGLTGLPKPLAKLRSINHLIIDNGMQLNCQSSMSHLVSIEGRP